MEDKLDKILSELQNTNNRIGNMETGQGELTKGQKELTGRLENLETGQGELTKGQKELTGRLENLETGQGELTKGQKELSGRMENLETGQGELTKNQKELSSRMEKGYEEILVGQTEIKEIINHTTTLMTENFTYIRKDMRAFQLDVNADIELLFKEVANVKRKVNKLEQSNK